MLVFWWQAHLVSAFLWIPVRAVIPAGLMKPEGKGHVRPKYCLFLSLLISSYAKVQRATTL